MKKIFSIAIIVSILYSCGPKKSDIQKLSAEEVFSDDTYLRTVTNKKAMVVVAHDDDPAAMAGTLAKLNAEGWEIKEICLVSVNPERDSALLVAASYILDEVEFIKMTPKERRPDLDSTVEPYTPIPKESIKSTFRYNELAKLIVDKINEYKPSVIFSLDNVIGGYGHPEHVLVSQLLVDSFATGSIKPERIYQSVYTNSMEKKILRERLTKLLKEWGFPNSYNTVTELYKVDGMPEPDVEINITAYSEKKMSFLLSFSEREKKTIDFFVPHFQNFDHKEYFEVFNREFFRIIKPSGTTSLN
ncbi:MAG: LmbE family protein [Bacteroidetes bacterium]|jgi:LmbE family N-acetylglucosaminyl deacetylase|nr:LmbE family protein [Bacteroidota bacterium]